jgi:hypothetical protein
LGSEIKRRSTPSLSRVDSSASRQQELHHVDMAPLGSLSQCGRSLNSYGVGISAGPEQKLDHIGMAFLRGYYQRGDAVDIRGVHPRPGREEELDHVGVTGLGSTPKWRVGVDASINICVLFYEFLNGGGVTSSGRFDQLFTGGLFIARMRSNDHNQYAQNNLHRFDHETLYRLAATTSRASTLIII